jgi:hypothetical protein
MGVGPPLGPAYPPPWAALWGGQTGGQISNITISEKKFLGAFFPRKPSLCLISNHFSKKFLGKIFVSNFQLKTLTRVVYHVKASNIDHVTTLSIPLRVILSIQVLMQWHLRAFN